MITKRNIIASAAAFALIGFLGTVSILDRNSDATKNEPEISAPSYFDSSSTNWPHPQPGNPKPVAQSVHPYEASPVVGTQQAVDMGVAELERYHKAADCAWANNVQSRAVQAAGGPGAERVAAMKAKCVGIAPVDVRERLVHLEKAAELGVPGAARFFRSEGPFGDYSALKTRPDDLLVVEWKEKAAHYFDVALEHGDLSVLNDIAIENMVDKITPVNMDKAFSYAVAARELGQLDGNGRMVLMYLDSFVEPEQKARAIAAGNALAERVRPK